MARQYDIQTAAMRHIPFLPAIELAGASIFPPGFLPAHSLTETLPRFLLEEGVRRGTLMVALEKVAGPVGYALLRFLEGVALLAQIDVLPEHGRRGLGTALVKKIAERARREGYEALYLTTFRQIPWNGPFYARLGFAEPNEADLPRVMRDILADERDAGYAGRAAMRLGLSPEA